MHSFPSLALADFPFPTAEKGGDTRCCLHPRFVVRSFTGSNLVLPGEEALAQTFSQMVKSKHT